MFSLYWWTYLVIGLSVFVSTAAAVRYEEWRESKRKTGSCYPCFVHMGAQESGAEMYCGRLDGHAGDHGTEVLVTFPETLREPVSEPDQIEWPAPGWTSGQQRDSH